MNIMHIAQCAGGVDRYLSMLLPLLHHQELHQILVCSKDYKVEEYVDKVDKVEQVDMGQSLNPVTIISVVMKIRHLIKQYCPDIVYCHSSMAGGMGRLACIGLPVNIVYNPHGWAFNMKSSSYLVNRLKNHFFLWIEKILSRYTDMIICISEAERDSALRNAITEDEKLKVILNGINIKAIDEAVPFTKTSLGIPKDAYLVGMVGRISSQKAPDTFIKAAHLIKKHIPKAWFMIVGDGEMRKEIEMYAKEHGIGLYITGWTDAPYSYMKMFDLAMLLSRWEGFGLAIVEYMAAGKNFIAARTDAIPTIVRDEEDGLLVEVDNPELVAKSALLIYTDKELAAKQRENAIKNATEKYDIHRVAEQHIEMFNKLIEKK